jgi:hypothetical protein
MRKRATVWPYWTGGILLLLLFLAFCYRDNRNYVCEDCHSHQTRNQPRVGCWMGFSLPLSPPTISDLPSHLYADYFPPNHRHDWIFAQGSPYGIFGWGG